MRDRRAAESPVSEQARIPAFRKGSMRATSRAIRRGAYRVVYALQIGTEIWVVHAFQKKSKADTKTPKAEIDLVRERLKRLKERVA
jgi:phage-related protein